MRHLRRQGSGRPRPPYDTTIPISGIADEWDGGDLSVYGRIALEYGLRFSTMQREWAEWAAARSVAKPRLAETPPERTRGRPAGAGARPVVPAIS
jgi:hypothetical protein